MNKIICNICGKEFKSLSGHLKIHGLDKISYCQIYPEAIMNVITDEQKKKISLSHWSKKDPEEIKEIKKAISENGKLSMKKLNESGKAFRMKPGFWSQEHKGYMRDLMTGRKLDDDWKQRIKENHWSKKEPDEVIEILHKIQDNSLGNKSWFFSQKMKQSFFCASNWEKIKMENYDLDNNVLKFTNRHGIKIPYYFNDQEHVYIPDLLIEFKNGLRLIEEIKGYVRNLNQLECKIQAAHQYAKLHGMEYRITYEPR